MMSYPTRDFRNDQEHSAADAGHLIGATATAARARHDRACKNAGVPD
jgi:hypothetical protein